MYAMWEKMRQETIFTLHVLTHLSNGFTAGRILCQEISPNWEAIVLTLMNNKMPHGHCPI